MALGDDKFADFLVDNYAAFNLKPPQSETCPNLDPIDIDCFSTLEFFLSTRLTCASPTITIHMPQRTSKILLVRLTANRNALLFLIRVTIFARYTVWFGVTRSGQTTVNDYFTISTITYFDWFPLHSWRRKLIVLHTFLHRDGSSEGLNDILLKFWKIWLPSRTGKLDWFFLRALSNLVNVLLERKIPFELRPYFSGAKLIALKNPPL